MLRNNILICWRFCRSNRIPTINNNFRRTSKEVFRRYSANVDNKGVNETIDEGPIKFSTSQASKHRAKTSRQGFEDTRLPYEGEVIMVCIVTFLVYFCILREENDIDKELDRSLYSRIEGLEELQLKLSLQYNQQQGLDTEAIEKRLEEIESHKKAREEVQEHA